ncbi:MAG: STAS domain-containing protein [Anaerolineae bacterium]|nr:STAS domain-containing protein [Anaerolineae bacterium]
MTTSYFLDRELILLGVVIALGLLGAIGGLVRKNAELRRMEEALRASNRELEEARREVERHNSRLQAVVRDYVAHMREIERGNLSARLPISGEVEDTDDPLLTLGLCLNRITASLQSAIESERAQREIIEAQQQAIYELSTPIIPLMEVPGTGSIIVVPLIGAIDSVRARNVTRRILEGISDYNASVVILDITGVPVVDSGVAGYLNRSIQAARLKGARVIVTGISDAVAETIIELGIDWRGIETLRDLQMGLVAALNSLGLEVVREERPLLPIPAT